MSQQHHTDLINVIPTEVLKSLNDIVITFDTQGQLGACSPAAAILLGIQQSEILSCNIVDLLLCGEAPADLSVLCGGENALQLNLVGSEKIVPVDAVIIPMQRDGEQWYVALLKKSSGVSSAKPPPFNALASSTLDQVDNAIIVLNDDGGLFYRNTLARQWVSVDEKLKYGWEPSNLASTIEDEFGDPVFDLVEHIQTKLRAGQTQLTTMVADRFGTERRILMQLIEVPAEQEESGKIVLVIKDVTRAFEFSHLLSYQSTHDQVTGCYNRKALESEIRALLHADSDIESSTLCLLRFDQLDIIINNCGYAAEEEVLCELKALIQPFVKEQDLLARLRGGEFGLIFHELDLQQSQTVIETLINKVEAYRFRHQGVDYSLSVNVGIVPIVADKDSFDQIMMSASTARQLARELGRNQIYLHDSAVDSSEQLSDRGWLVKIQSALDADRLRVYCQPIEPLNKNGERHYEILVRMVSEEGELIPPEDFIRAAERYGWIGAIEYWVIEETCMLLQLLASKNADQRWHFFINLSGSSVGDERLEAFITEQLARLKQTGSRLSFEITETAAIDDFDKAAQFMRNLRAVGCNFSLDDFGSGLSSFSYLQRLPVDYIKIDGEFIRDIISNKMHQVIVESIVHISRKANMKTIAEYVQNQQIHDLLAEIGIDFVQGSNIGMPRPVKDLFNISLK